MLKKMYKKMILFLLILTMNLSSLSCTAMSDTKVSHNSNGKATVTDKQAINQYELKSEYLKNPDRIKIAADQTAQFWEKAYDSKYGGFYTYVNEDGSIDSSKTYKVTLIQSRDAYAFVRAYQLTGNEEYLKFARKGLDFMYKNAWDEVNTGWNQELNRDGSLASTPLEGMDWNSMKWSFNQYYALCGITAMYDATRGKIDESWLSKSYASLDKKMWDYRPGYEGYYDMAAKDWSNIGGKSIGVMDAITTHAETMYLIDSDITYKNRFLKVADNLSEHLVKSMDQRQFGMDENFDSNWKAVEQQETTTGGNLLKPAWCLARAYLADPRPEYKNSAAKLLDEVLNSGTYDKVNGGVFTTIDAKSGNTTDNKKSWWMQEQAVTSGLTNYYISKNTSYLKMADESIDFFMKHMYDSKYGEAYSDSNSDGSNPVKDKGTYWKDAYHTMELFYYTYLYGNLMLNNKPASLYYNIDPEKEARKTILKPVSLGENKLLISEVTLNGKPYKNFNAKKCILNIPANTGGEFKVTFTSAIG